MNIRYLADTLPIDERIASLESGANCALRRGTAKSTNARTFVHAAIYNTFNFQRHLISRSTLLQFRAEAMSECNDVTAAA
jgi:hypothetical protein